MPPPAPSPGCLAAELSVPELLGQRGVSAAGSVAQNWRSPFGRRRPQTATSSRPESLGARPGHLAPGAVQNYLAASPAPVAGAAAVERGLTGQRRPRSAAARPPPAALPLQKLRAARPAAVRAPGSASGSPRGGGSSPASRSPAGQGRVSPLGTSLDSDDLPFFSANLHPALAEKPNIQVNAKCLADQVERMRDMVRALVRGSGYQDARLSDPQDGRGGEGSDADRDYIALLVMQERIFLHELQQQGAIIARLQHEESRAQRQLQDLREECEAQRHVLDQHQEELRSRDERIEALLKDVGQLELKLREAGRQLHATSGRKSFIPRTPLSRLGNRGGPDSVFRGAAPRDSGTPVLLPAPVPAAPAGNVTLAFTDIQGSTRLWEHSAQGMQQALRIHNQVVREAVEYYQGYEVKTVGDAFMVAFREPRLAVACSLSVQLELVEQHWPQALLTLPDCAVEALGDGPPAGERSLVAAAVRLPGSDPLRLASGEADHRLLKRVSYSWNGIRVRIGLNQGRPICEVDPCTGRMDYFGPVVNKSARIESQALGGMVAATQEVCDAILPHTEVLGHPVIEHHATVSLKGFAEPVKVMRILPQQLVGRRELFDATLAAAQQRSAERERVEHREERRRKRRELDRMRRAVEQGSRRDSQRRVSHQEPAAGEDSASSDETEEEADVLPAAPPAAPNYVPHTPRGRRKSAGSGASTVEGPQMPRGAVCFAFARIENIDAIRQQLTGGGRTGSLSASMLGASAGGSASSAWDSLMSSYTAVLRSAAEELELPYVRSDGDRIIVACGQPVRALQWCLLTQQRLMNASWPEQLAEVPEVAAQKWRDAVCLSGPRVQMGVHIAPDATLETDAYGRYSTYVGDEVVTAGELAAQACGGQIILSETVYDAVIGALAELGAPVVNLMGTFQGRFQVFQCYPRVLVGRLFLLMGFSEAASAGDEYRNFKQQLVAEEAKRCIAGGEQGSLSVLLAFRRQLSLVSTVQGALLAAWRKERRVQRRRGVRITGGDIMQQVELLELHRMAAEDMRFSEDMYLLPQVSLSLAEAGAVVEHVASSTRRSTMLRRMRQAPSVDLGHNGSPGGSCYSPSARSSVSQCSDPGGDADGASPLFESFSRRKGSAPGSPAGGRTGKRAAKNSSWRGDRAERDQRRKSEAESKEATEMMGQLRGRLAETMSALLSVHMYVRHFAEQMKIYIEQTRAYEENDLVHDWVGCHHKIQEGVLGTRAKRASKMQAAGQDFRAMTMFTMGEKEEGSADMLKDPTKMARSVVGHLSLFIEWARAFVRRRQASDKAVNRELLSLRTRASVAQKRTEERMTSGAGFGWQGMLRSASPSPTVSEAQRRGTASDRLAAAAGAAAQLARRRNTVSPEALGSRMRRQSQGSNASDQPSPPQHAGSARRATHHPGLRGDAAPSGNRFRLAALHAARAGRQTSPGKRGSLDSPSPNLSAGRASPPGRRRPGSQQGSVCGSAEITPLTPQAEQEDPAKRAAATGGAQRAVLDADFKLLPSSSAGQLAAPSPRDDGSSSCGSPTARWRKIGNLLRAVGQARRAVTGPTALLAVAAVDQVCQQAKRRAQAGGPRRAAPATCDAVADAVTDVLSEVSPRPSLPGGGGDVAGGADGSARSPLLPPAAEKLASFASSHSERSEADGDSPRR